MALCLIRGLYFYSTYCRGQYVWSRLRGLQQYFTRSCALADRTLRGLTTYRTAFWKSGTFSTAERLDALKQANSVRSTFIQHTLPSLPSAETNKFPNYSSDHHEIILSKVHVIECQIEYF
jgi:hypothetical protein